MTATADLVRDLFRLLAERDLEGARERLHPELVLRIGGANRISGEYRGIDAWFDLARRIFEMTDTFDLRLHDVLGSDDHAVALVDARAERDGRTLEWGRVFVYHVRDGRVVEVWIHETDQAAVDGFFA